MSSTVAVSQWTGGVDNTLAGSNEIFYTLETTRASIVLVTAGERARLNLVENLVPVFHGQATLFFIRASSLFHFHESPGTVNHIEFSVLPIRAPPFRHS